VLVWLNTTWACGGVVVQNGVIVNTCPIYYKYRGRKLTSVVSTLGNQLLEAVTITDERNPVVDWFMQRGDF